MEDKMKDVPYIVHESIMVRMERTIKRLVVALVVCIVLMFTSNVIWLYFWNQYDYVDESSQQYVSVDGKDGIANYIGNDGDIVNGKDSGDYQEEESQETEEER